MPWLLALASALGPVLAEVAFPCAGADAFCRAEAGAALELVQVAAKARRGNSSRSLDSAAIEPPAGVVEVDRVEELKQQQSREIFARGGTASGDLVARSGLSTEAYKQALSGIWDCEASRFTGLKTVYLSGDAAIIHTGCKEWQGVFENGILNVTDPPWVADTHCYLVSGKMQCGSIDTCTRFDRKPPWQVTPPDNSFAGKWKNIDGDGTENSTYVITKNDVGELLYNAPGNLSGYLYPTDDGYIQTEVCMGGVITGSSVRFKLSKSKRSIQSNVYVPTLGMTEWGPQAYATKVGKESKFPWTLVAIPLVALMFLLPASLFFLGAEGKAVAAKKPEAMAKSKQQREKEAGSKTERGGRPQGEISTSFGGL